MTRPPNRFVGRQTELDTANKALAEARLVTLLGPGGVGKTRLAKELAAQTDDSMVIELDQTRTGEGMLSVLTSALRLTASGHQPAAVAARAVSHQLEARGVRLLVLDNLEQVIEPAARLISQWLDEVHELRVLATSRERLNITGEVVLELTPLPPEAAIELFVSRARDARRNYQPTDDDRGVIAEIARKLDHMPLAIELAAARVPVLSPSQMLARLDRRFELLKSTARDLTPRQRTLRGAMDWGWELLEPWEQTALAQCGVFQGGFDVDAAEAVIDLGDAPDAPLAIDALQSLRDKSLVLVEDEREHDDQLRFSMYETIRDYARERLSEGDAASTRARHRDYYLALGEQLAEGAVGPDAEACVQRLAREEANLVAVHHNATDAESAARAALCLEPLLSTRGPWEAWKSLVDATVRTASGASPQLHARALLGRGNLIRQVGQMDEARADFTEALQLARDANDEATEAYALALLGIIERSVGNKVEADEHLSHALALAQGIGDRRTEAVTRVSLGFLRLEQDRPTEAEEHSRRSLAIARAIGDRNVESIAIVQLANLLVDAGQLDEGVVVYEEALQLARRTQNRRTEGMVLANIAHVRIERGELTEASAELAIALDWCRSVGNLRFVGIVLGYQSLLAREQGKLDEARDLVEQALDVHRDMGTVRWVTEELRNLAVLHLLDGDLDTALDCLAEALSESGDSGLTLQDGRAEALIAIAHAERDEVTEAEAALKSARERFSRIDDNQAPVLLGLTEAHLALARVRAGAGDASKAVARLDDARPVAAVSAEVRVGITLLERRLDEMGIEGGEGPVGSEHLVIGPGARWFQPPHSEAVDVSRRRVLRRILTGLVEHRLSAPGDALDRDGVLEAGWPGEKILPDAANNRIYVAIATLRKLGLGDVLLTRKDGYLLDPAVSLERSG